MKSNLQSLTEVRDAADDVHDDQVRRDPFFERYHKNLRASRNTKHFWPHWTALASVAVAVSLLFLMVKCFLAASLASEGESRSIISHPKGRLLSEGQQPFHCGPAGGPGPEMSSRGAARLTSSDYENNNSVLLSSGSSTETSGAGNVESHSSGAAQGASAAPPSPQPSPETSSPASKRRKRNLTERRGGPQVKVKIPSPGSPQPGPSSHQQPTPGPSRVQLELEKLEKLTATNMLVARSRDQLRERVENVRRLAPTFFSWWMMQNGDDDVFE
ncbi:hypothetical protein ACSSS7_004825 [Eimeria intestinalis]